MPFEYLAEFSRWEKVSLEWLAWGEGPEDSTAAIQWATRQSVPARALGILDALSSSPELARAVEMAADKDSSLRKTIEKLPRLKADQLDAIARLVDTFT